MKRLILGCSILGLLLVAVIISPNAHAGNGNELYITSDNKAESTQGVVLSDSQLLSLFNVASNYDELLNGKMTVEHDIDFNAPGTYNVKFIASYQEVLCFDDKEDADGNGTGKNDSSVIGTYCQNNADDGEVGDNDTYKFIDKQKIATAHLTVVAKPKTIELYADNNYSDYEHKQYTDQQLIDAFNLEVLNNTGNLPITVSHVIDWEKPGLYDVTFTVGDVSKTVKYEVLDLKPTLTSNSEYTINVGDTFDYFVAYNIDASEFASKDLNQYVRIHDDEVDYTKPGDYTFSISVSDHEENVVIKTITLHIVEKQVEETPVLNSKEKVIIKVGNPLTDEEIINMFELTANYDLDLSKIQVVHNIDFTKVGEYEITFTDPVKGTTTTSILKIVEDIENGLQIDRICTKVGDKLTKQDYIDAYNAQIGKIKDQAVIETLEIDDSLVDYYTPKTYQVNIYAQNSEGKVLNRVLALCVTGDTEEPSEVESEEPSEVESEEPSEVESEEPSEVESEEPSEVESEDPLAETCVQQHGLINRKISSIQIAPSDSISDSKLRALFEQPGSVDVIHNIIPDQEGTYQVDFELQGCNFTGKVIVDPDTVVYNRNDLEDFLNENGLNNLSPDEVSEGTYSITTTDPESGEEKQMTLVYSLANTGNQSIWIFIGLVLIGSTVIIIKRKQ